MRKKLLIFLWQVSKKILTKEQVFVCVSVETWFQKISTIRNGAYVQSSHPFYPFVFFHAGVRSVPGSVVASFPPTKYKNFVSPPTKQNEHTSYHPCAHQFSSVTFVYGDVVRDTHRINDRNFPYQSQNHTKCNLEHHPVDIGVW